MDIELSGNDIYTLMIALDTVIDEYEGVRDLTDEYKVREKLGQYITSLEL